ncbi:MAG TPA: helix-turn-helix transcriptional regulator [Verrucomicrobiae bacterium]
MTALSIFVERGFRECVPLLMPATSSRCDFSHFPNAVNRENKIYTERVWLILTVSVSVAFVLKKNQRRTIGQAILKYRIKACFSQESLAEKADIHPNYVGRIERGECSPTVEVLIRLAKALNVRPYKFLLKI